MAKQKIVLVAGQKFGKLTVTHPDSGFSACLCDCGIATVVKNCHLTSGNTTSCGCKKKYVLANSRRIHGRSNSRLTGYKDRTYGIWQAMKDRCANPNRKDWHNYGGRGILVCDEWKNSFEAFVQDMGNAPEGKTIDRIDVNGNYTKENCRWITLAEQSANQRKSIRYTIDGITKTVNGWAKEWGIWWMQAKRILEKIETQ